MNIPINSWQTSAGTVTAGAAATTIAAAVVGTRIVLHNAAIYQASANGEMSLAMGAVALADTGWDLDAVANSGWLPVKFTILPTNTALTVACGGSSGTGAYRATWARIPG